MVMKLFNRLFFFFLVEFLFELQNKIIEINIFVVVVKRRLSDKEKNYIPVPLKSSEIWIFVIYSLWPYINLGKWICEMSHQTENRKNDNYAESFENEDVVYIFITHVQIFIFIFI